LSRKESSAIGLGVEDDVIERKVFISNDGGVFISNDGGVFISNDGGIFIVPKCSLSYLRDFEASNVVGDGTDNLAIPLLRQKIEDVSLCFSRLMSISRSSLRVTKSP
jgi:hypothetical protein